jgi:serine/threonine-protein kinase
VAAEAEQRLRAAGFGVTRQEAFSASVPVGRVVEQNPPAGTQRPAGASVVIVVSRGAQGQVVPNVVGMQESQAIATLQNAGLRVNPNVNRQGRDQVPERVLETVCIGCVLSTSPAAGTTADASTVVNIAVRRE